MEQKQLFLRLMQSNYTELFHAWPYTTPTHYINHPDYEKAQPVEGHLSSKHRPALLTLPEISLPKVSEHREAYERSRNERYVYLIRAYQIMKALGYAGGMLTAEGKFERVRGQSVNTGKPGFLCITDAMTICCGILIAGENIRDGIFYPGAELTLQHLYPSNIDIVESIQERILAMQDEALSVTVYLAGGNSEDRQSATLGSELLKILDMKDVTPGFNKLFEKPGNSKAMLAGVIESDHRIRGISEVYRDDTKAGN